jgi:hypothetical protein
MTEFMNQFAASTMRGDKKYEGISLTETSLLGISTSISERKEKTRTHVKPALCKPSAQRGLQRVEKLDK